MDTSIIIAAISALAAIVVAATTYYTTKERERKAEWRKEKLTQQTVDRKAPNHPIGPQVYCQVLS